MLITCRSFYAGYHECLLKTAMRSATFRSVTRLEANFFRRMAAAQSWALVALAPPTCMLRLLFLPLRAAMVTLAVTVGPFVLFSCYVAARRLLRYLALPSHREDCCATIRRSPAGDNDL